jgi:hypothetical protein
MEEEEMATEPKDALSAQIESTIAPPVAFTVIHSDESAGESPEATGAPDSDSTPAETIGASVEIQEADRVGEDEAAEAPPATVRNKASATAFEQNFAASKDRMVAINIKVLQAFLANAETNLDFLTALPSVRSLSELIALQSEFACKQVDAMVRPAAEIGAMTQNTMASALDAMRNQITRSVRN